MRQLKHWQTRPSGYFDRPGRRACLLGGQGLGGLGELGRLGRQEERCQEGARRGNASGDEGTDGEAAQEGVAGCVLQRLAERRVAEGRDLAGGGVGGADGLVGDRRHRAWHTGGQGGGQP
jgi:hypothetical protein